MSLIVELKRRNVIRIAVLYLVAGWLALQIADVVFPALGVPEWSMRLILGVLIVCFPLALIFSWVYEMTPEGIKREKDIDRSQSITPDTGRKINVLIITLLVLAIAAVVADRLIPERAIQQAADATPPATGDTAAATDTAQTMEPAAMAAAKFLSTAPEQSVAVLPFVNMSGNADNEFFSDGLSEELLNVLAGTPGLFVAARTSSFYFKGHTGDIADVARQLRVRNVLEGSVRTAGERVRITAQLIDATNGYHLWSQTFDRTLEDVFAVQDEISRHVAEALKVALLPETAVADAKPTENMEAYLAYLRGQQHLSEGGVDGYSAAVADFEQAVALDPGFAAAYAGIAIGWAEQADWGNIGWNTAGPPVRAAADRALALDPDLALAWAVDGLAHAYAGPETNDDPAVLASLERAVSMDPNDVWILTQYGNALVWAGRPDESIEVMQRGLIRDPLSAKLHAELAGVLRRKERLELAAQHFQSAMELNPGDPFPPDGVAHVWRDRGRFDEAVRWQVRVIALDPDDTYSRSLIVTDYLELGDTDRARAWQAVADRMDADAAKSRESRALLAWFRDDRAAAVAEADRLFADQMQGIGSAGGWMRALQFRYHLDAGDIARAIEVRFQNGLPAVPDADARVTTGQLFDLIAAAAAIRARDGQAGARDYAGKVLAWGTRPGAGNLPTGQRELLRCAMLAQLDRPDEAATACRAGMDASANSDYLALQIVPTFDPVRDAPAWRQFMAETEAGRAQQLAALRGSGDEPAPR